MVLSYVLPLRAFFPMYITQGYVSGKSPEVDSIAPNLPLGNCDIDFLTFAIAAKSEISKFLNQSEQNQNCAVNFWKHW